MAANALHNSRSALGAFFRRLRARIGTAKALTATARKIAVQYYRLITTKQPFVDIGESAYLENFRDRAIKRLQHQAQKYGMRLVGDVAPPPASEDCEAIARTTLPQGRTMLGFS
jgi:hypothetical protein